MYPDDTVLVQHTVSLQRDFLLSRNEANILKQQQTAIKAVKR